MKSEYPLRPTDRQKTHPLAAAMKRQILKLLRHQFRWCCHRCKESANASVSICSNMSKHKHKYYNKQFHLLTWTALSVYKICGSWPSHGAKPPVFGHWHFLINSTISSFFSFDSSPIRSSAVTPQYMPDIRKNSVMQYSYTKRFYSTVKANH